MADQTQVGNGKVAKDRTAMAALQDDLGELAGDVLTLAQLQMQLFWEDSAETAHRASPAAMAIVAGGVLALACIPVVVLGIAYSVSRLGIDLGLSMLLVAVVFIAIGVLAAAMSWRILKRAGEPLKRSRYELLRNYEWLKRTLAKRARPPSAKPNTAG